MVTTGYTDSEGAAMVGPFVGWPAEDIAAFVVVTVDYDGRAGFGASSRITAEDVPCLLRSMADGIEKEVSRS